jgi:hypothetical protein
MHLRITYSVNWTGINEERQSAGGGVGGGSDISGVEPSCSVNQSQVMWLLSGPQSTGTWERSVSYARRSYLAISSKMIIHYKLDI